MILGLTFGVFEDDGIANAANNPIKIAVVAPFNTPPGERLVDAAMMAAEEINAAGGIGGKQFELLI